MQHFRRIAKLHLGISSQYINSPRTREWDEQKQISNLQKKRVDGLNRLFQDHIEYRSLRSQFDEIVSNVPDWQLQQHTSWFNWAEELVEAKNPLSRFDSYVEDDPHA